jgi:hypothetical protein
MISIHLDLPFLAIPTVAGGLYQGKWFCSPWPDELPSLNDKTYLWLFSNFIKSWWLLSYGGPNGNVRKFFFIVTMKQLLR